MDHSYKEDSVNRPEFLCDAEVLGEGQFCELATEIAGQPTFLVATRHCGQPRAWLNVCPHQGRELNWAPNRFLTDEQGHLVCAAHGAVFEPEQGRCISGPCRNAYLEAIEIEERNQKIYLKKVL
jgi:nitrite reductase/ring-hydroxylating ferredoxin subunit